MSTPVVRLRFSSAAPKLRARVIPGIPPLQAQFRAVGTLIQWRVGASGPWTDLVDIASLVVAPTEQTITAAGTYAVADNAGKVFVSLAAPGTVTLNLGKSANRASVPLTVVDMKGNATIVLNADATDTGGINGASAAQINSSGAGFGLAGGATFYPKASLNAWAGIA